MGKGEKAMGAGSCSVNKRSQAALVMRGVKNKVISALKETGTDEEKEKELAVAHP